MNTTKIYLFTALLILQTTSCKEKLVVECKNSGIWSEGKCQCLPSYYGPLCEQMDSCLAEEPKSCNGFPCEAGKCNCVVPWNGVNCEKLDPLLLEGKYEVIGVIFENPNQTRYASPLKDFIITNLKKSTNNAFNGKLGYEDFKAGDYSGLSDVSLKIDTIYPEIKKYQLKFKSEHWHEPQPQFEFDCQWSNDTLYCDGIYLQRPNVSGGACFHYKLAVEEAKFIAVKQK